MPKNQTSVISDSHGLALGAILEQIPAVVDGGGAELLLHGDHQQHHVLPPLLLRLPLLAVLHLSQVVAHLPREGILRCSQNVCVNFVQNAVFEN